MRKGADKSTCVVQLDRCDLVKRLKEEGAPDSVTEDNVLPFYKSCVTREILEGFFAKMVVLVEGPSEAQALPLYLESAEPSLVCSRDGVAVIPVGGKGNLAKWQRLFAAYGVPTYVVFDNDPGDDDRAVRRRDALSALGVSKDAAEQVLGLGNDAWLVEDSFCVFGDEFEAGLRAHFETYATLEEQARDEGAEGKPFLARAVALRLQAQAREQAPGSGWAKIDELAAAIRRRLL